MRRPNGIGIRIALAALAVAAVGIGLLALGVLLVGSQTFADLMAAHGEPADSSRSMFEASVVRVLVVTAVLAAIVALVLAALVGRRLARPLQEIGAAARRIARGDYAGRVPRTGPEEIVGLADSFNQMAAALEEQERMRREFIANAAHELRTPLTNLKGYLEALRDGVVAPEPAVFASLWEEAERLVRLSRSLDVLAEGDSAPPRPLVELDLVRAIRSAVELAAPSVRSAALELAVDVPTRLPVLADPDGLAQVLANLLQNAVRYTPAGGRVTVRGEGRPGTVLVSVSNTGPGIPAEDLPHMFERFYRVDRARAASSGGAGIGLAIVRQIVEAGGGRVGAESSDGLTRVWFSLPSASG
jgi:signal transduction histidine kinase